MTTLEEIEGLVASGALINDYYSELIGRVRAAEAAAAQMRAALDEVRARLAPTSDLGFDAETRATQAAAVADVALAAPPHTCTAGFRGLRVGKEWCRGCQDGPLKGWVSPEAHAAVVAERDRLAAACSARSMAGRWLLDDRGGHPEMSAAHELLSQQIARNDMAEARAAMGVLMTIVAQRLEKAEAERDEAVAQAAVMREATRRLLEMADRGRGGWSFESTDKDGLNAVRAAYKSLTTSAGRALSEEVRALRAFFAEAARLMDVRDPVVDVSTLKARRAEVDAIRAKAGAQ